MEIKDKLHYINRQIKYRTGYFFTMNKAIKNDGIIMIFHDFEYAGAQVLAFNIIKSFVKMNVPVVAIGYQYGPLVGQLQKYCPVFVCAKKNIVTTANKLKNKYGYNKVICNTVVTGLFVEQLKKERFIVVSLIHEMEQLIKNEKLEEECQEIWDYSDYVVFPSTYVQASVKKCIKESKIRKNVYIRPQGLYNIDKRNITKEKSVVELSNLLRITLNKKFIVIGVGTACIRKGFDLFIEIAYKVGQVDNDIVFIWVGDKIQDILKEKLLKYNIKEIRNLVLTGYITDKDIFHNIYNAANVLCLTSREEPFGSIVLEAFQSCTPVIAFRGCGGYMDIVRDYDTGYLVEPYDIDSVINKIFEVKNNPVENNKIGLNCYRETQKHNFEKYCRFIFRLFVRE